MPFISFLGCDGAGKSAVIARVASSLEASGEKVVCGHWRPVALAVGNAEAARANADDPHGKTPRGLASSLLKLGWLWLNWWFGWWKTLRKDRNVGFVLFDRFHGDLLVDPRRYRYGGPMWAAALATRCMPQPDLVLFLDAEPEVLLSRKREVSEEALVASRNAYLALCHQHDCYEVVDASRSLSCVTDEVLRRMRALPS